MRRLRRISLLLATAATIACGRAAFVGAGTPGGSPTPSATATPATFRKSVTIPRAGVGTASTMAITGFPVLVSIVDTDLRLHVRDALGRDILFEGLDAQTCGGSPPCALRREIAAWDPATGTLRAWVRVPSLHGPASGSDTVLSMVYGDSTQPSDPGAWDASYKAVWHLAEGAGDTAADSLGIHGVALSATTWTSAGALAPLALGFNGTNATAWAGSADDLRMTTAYTVEGWGRSTSVSGARRIFFHGGLNGGPFSSYGLGVVNQNVRFEMNIANALRSVDSTTVIQPGLWYRIAGTWDGQFMRVYVGSALEATAAVSGSIVENNSRSSIGFSGVTPANFWAGSLQEIRVSDVARSTEWLATSSRNESSPSTFVLLGTQIAQ